MAKRIDKESYFNRLNQARRANPTGNVRGQLSEKELSLIRDAMTKLGPPNKSALAPRRGQTGSAMGQLSERERALLRAAQKRMR